MTENKVSGDWMRIHRRVRAMHRLWILSIADLTVEQINYQERPGVVPIAFSLMHYVPLEDLNIGKFLLKEPTVWESGGWADRIGGNHPKTGRGTPVEVAETARIGDAEAWRQYQQEVFDRTEHALLNQPHAVWHSVVADDVVPEFDKTFIGYVVDPGEPVRMSEVINGFIFQHGIRHLGEIDHARSLLGLTGVS